LTHYLFFDSEILRKFIEQNNVGISGFLKNHYKEESEYGLQRSQDEGLADFRSCREKNAYPGAVG
jgi:hypothetical protein